LFLLKLLLRMTPTAPVENSSRKLLIVSTVLSIVFFITGYSFSSNYSESTKQSASFLISDTLDVDSSTETSTNNLQISVYNYYTENDPVVEYPWALMAEPFRASKMKVVSGHVDGASYQWFVEGHKQGTGQVVDILFPTVGRHTVSLIQTLTDGTQNTADFEVMVKYVRREIRSLTDADREAFFSAISVLQRVPTRVGQKVFGSKYKSKDHFNRLHLYYGGTKDCDHWHQGAGFVTSHVAMTLEYEQALQSVNPSISVPYWDFTLESTFYDASTWRSSPVFSDDWFGHASPPNDLKTMTSGRFAFVPTLTNAYNYSAVVNSYGLLRAPWNNDPTPFVTRSDEIYGYKNNLKPSGCAEYYRSLKKDNWMAMSRQLNSAAHGHIHELLGGSWNSLYAEEMGLNQDQVHPSIFTFAHEIQALSKELWRSGYVICPESCSMDTPAKECMCSCTQETLEGKSAYEILDDAGVLASAEFFDSENHLISSWYDENGTVYYTLPGYSFDESQHIYKSLLHHLCNPGHIGTMFQATSTNDMTFWILHGALDRLWHWKRLANDPDYDETWDPYHTCYGHNPENIQPFKNLFGDTDSDYYSNDALYSLLHPASETLPYVYDNFRWPHCEAQGYDMTNMKSND